MGAHMKTTVEVNDGLMVQAKRFAKRQGITLRELIESGLRRELAERKTTSAGRTYRLPDRLRRDGAVKPGIDLADWRQIRDLIHGATEPGSRSQSHTAE